MLPPPETRWWRLLLGYLLFTGLLALALTPLYFLVQPAHRPGVVRLGAALLAMVALIHLRRIARERLEAQPASAFERALQPPPTEQHIAPLLLKLRDEVRISTTDRRYFENILWARILRILRERRRGPSAAPEMPRGSRYFRRGPSLTALRDLIEQIEERP
jgi:hypothetical protein